MAHKGPYTYCDFEVRVFNPPPPFPPEKYSLFFSSHTESFDANKTWMKGLPKRDMMIWIINSKHAKTKIISFVFLFCSYLPTLNLTLLKNLFLDVLISFPPLSSFPAFISFLYLIFLFYYFLHYLLIPSVSLDLSLPVSSCYRLPCRNPRRMCQDGFYYSRLVCQCIPNHLRSEWN